jgi:DNA-directed RNA polymerase specialized sigma24 family protein
MGDDNANFTEHTVTLLRKIWEGRPTDPDIDYKNLEPEWRRRVGRLIERYYGYVAAVAGDQQSADVDDIIQSVVVGILQAWLRGRAFKPDSENEGRTRASWKAYLKTCIRRALDDTAEKRRRALGVPVDENELARRADALAQQLDDADLSVWIRIAAKYDELTDCVRRRLKDPSRYDLLVDLLLGDVEIDEDEVTQALGTDTHAVSQQLYRLKQYFRDCAKKLGYDDLLPEVP